MIRMSIPAAVVCVALATTPGVATMESGEPVWMQTTARVTSADAAPFLGDWTLAMQGPNGPGTFDLSVRAEHEKVVADIANESVPKQPINSISMAADKSLVLGYTFTWEGNPVDAVVTLTPSSEGPVKAQVDFAGGAYVMSGTATKKEAK